MLLSHHFHYTDLQLQPSSSTAIARGREPHAAAISNAPSQAARFSVSPPAYCMTQNNKITYVQLAMVQITAQGRPFIYAMLTAKNTQPMNTIRVLSSRLTVFISSVDAAAHLATGANVYSAYLGALQEVASLLNNVYILTNHFGEQTLLPFVLPLDGYKIMMIYYLWKTNRSLTKQRLTLTHFPHLTGNL